MERYVFAVGDDPFCVWGHNLSDRNESFLRSFDPDYFEYAAQRHVEQLGGSNGARAAVALRAAYHHGLEPLFSLLGALSQAPGCVPAWIPKCSNTVLRQLVGDISQGRPLLTQRGSQKFSWKLLAEVVHSHVWADETPQGATAERYATLWSRFAADFLDDTHFYEYNSIKHGFRVSSGGSVLRIGLEPSYGVPPSESAMQTIGASPHGTTFYVPEPIPAGAGRNHLHFRLRQRHLNWRAEGMVQALQLLSCSINNVVGCLRVLNGAQADTIRFTRPEDPEFFEAPWRWQVGVRWSDIDFVIDESLVGGVSRSQLRAELESRR